MLRVAQAFGNCPQYIHARDWRRVARPAPPPAPRRGAALDAAQQAWVAGADTLFVASGHRGDGEHPGYGMDASHRGGEPGFVEVVSGARLVIQDGGFSGFDKCADLPGLGCPVIDLVPGDLPEAGELDVDAVVELPGALALRFGADAGAVRSLRVLDVVRESEDVASFVLASRDGAALPDFAAGQHLPLQLRVPGGARRVRRSYSLSGPPGAAHYRISVKREPHGLASRLLHDAVTPGSILDAEAPAGDFVLSHGTRPAVLVSAGVGLTPLVAMLHAAAAAGRDAWFVHGARDGAHHPLRDEVARLVAAHPHLSAHVAYSRPRREDAGAYDSVGRVDGALLERALPDRDAEYYLCGPAGFLSSVAAGLRARGVAQSLIHTERFAGGA